MVCNARHRLRTVSAVQILAAGLAHHQAGRFGDAERIYHGTLTAEPGNPDALHLLGVLALQTGRPKLAVDWIQAALAVNPTAPIFYSNLGAAYRSLGELEASAAAYSKAIAMDPRFADAHYNLGNVSLDRGRIDEAITAFRHALALITDYAEAHSNLAIALAHCGAFDESIEHCRSALRIRPDLAEAHNNLGDALRKTGALDEAEFAFRKALQLSPAMAGTHNNLGNVMKDGGRSEEAVAAFRKALVFSPQYQVAWDNLLLTLHYIPGIFPESIRTEQSCWNETITREAPAIASSIPPSQDINPRLRIGYVSPDFRDHVVGRNLLPLLRSHDQSQIELVCYSAVLCSDSMTRVFKNLAHHWREVPGLSDAALAAMIREDGIDVLVDLSQHSAGNRLGVFALSPAPVQVSFAGYPAGTGLAAIRHRISDRFLEGGAARDAYGADEHVHHIDSFWCYDPCGMDVPIQPLPAASAGHITFGCLNNFCKVNREVIAFWVRVLGEVQHSRMLILSPDGTHRQQVRDQFFTSGIDPMRIEFASPCGRQAYLGLYHRIDISLDTFPYNGHTTSLDSLWMGVPVVSLCGPLPVTRAGLSQLTHLGLPELVADTAADYLRIAMSLASDIPRLLELRSTLRRRMEQSVLMDAPRFARQIEDAYREMWRASLTTGCSTPPA